MHHSIQAPSLPPDADDLYSPPPNLRAGQMASLVWSVMQLSSTTPDFAWCTVCRKWYRYRIDFNAAYIKTLFKHCKTQHYVAPDGTLRPISAAHLTAPTQPPPPRPPPATTAHPALTAADATQYRPKNLTQADLPFFRAQALHAQSLALARAQSTAFPATQPVPHLPLPPSAPLPTPPTPPTPPLPASAASVHAHSPTANLTPAQIASSIAFLQRQRAMQGQIISQAQALQILRQMSQQRPRPMQQPMHVLESHPGLSQQQYRRKMLARRAGQMNLDALKELRNRQGSGALSMSMSSPTVSSSPTLPTTSTASPGGVNVAQNSIPNNQTGSGRTSLLRTSAIIRVPNGALAPLNSASLQPMPKPSARAAAHPRTGNSPPPLRGAVQKKVIKRQIIPITANITRCELTSPVLKVASRSQDLIFSGASLFFTKAVFKVPSTEEEALDTMRTGTSDVDRDVQDGSPVNDLYFLSWSHTQFFAAQMAALGYRFLSSKLSRRAQKIKPPAVSEWLRLEKYHTIPRRMVQAGASVQKITAAAAGQGSVAPLGAHTRPASHSHMVAAAPRPNLNGVPPSSGRGLADATVMKAPAHGGPSNNSTSQQPSNPTSSKPTSNMTASPDAPSHAPSANAALPPGEYADANDVQVIDLT